MKKLFLLPILFFAVACGGGNSSSKTEEPKKEEAKSEDLSNNPDYQKGLALEAANDCKTCHTIDDKLTGPPFRQVANKYAGMPDTIVTHLAHKVISGGSGVWGEIMMTPHPALSEADAEAIVKYILLLKK
jgi:cytochrome c